MCAGASQDSLEFCLREEIEERQWAERVTSLKAQMVSQRYRQIQRL